MPTPRLLCLFASLLLFVLDAQAQLEQFIAEQYPAWEATYQHLHRNPELSQQEKETSAFLAEKMRRLGFDVQENFGEYGVVAVLKNGKGKTLLLRTDTDALPVQEQTGLPYSSQKQMPRADGGPALPVMHACGHDMHMSVWLATAEAAVAFKNTWTGTLVMIAQPSEEIGTGAKAMLEAGLYKKYPVPDYAVALHVSAGMPAGTIGFCKGPAMANVDMVNIKVFGEGGHGAYPHLTKDPIVLAARIVLALQTIVSREISPLEPAVVTVGAIHGGTKHNIIPPEVKLELTLRSYTEAVREQTLAAIRRIIRHTALSAGMSEDRLPVLEIEGNSLPAVDNDAALTEQLYLAVGEALGKDRIQWTTPVMGAEDFSLYGRTPERVPISLFWLGAVSEQTIAAHQKAGTPLPSLHSPYFAPDPGPTLRNGTQAMLTVVQTLLKK